MTKPYQVGCRLPLLAFLLGLSLLLLSACRQSGALPAPTAVPTLPTNPPSTTSAANQGISTAATPLPFPAATIPVQAAAVPPPSPTAIPQNAGQLTIGYSVQNRPISAYWAGSGERKVVVVGGREQTASLAAHYQTNPHTIPAGFTLWFLPDPNPDSLALDLPINSNGVNIYQNADTRFALCPDQAAGQQTGGPYPFSEPETRALHDLLAASWAALLLTAEPNILQPGGCGQHLPGAALAEQIRANTALALQSTPLPQGPLPQGHLIDYLAAEGTAAVLMSRDKMSTAVLEALLENMDQISGVEATAAGGTFQWVEAQNTSQWLFPPNTFIHPIAVERIDPYLYILDGGQVQRLDRHTAAMPEVILAPDDDVAGVRVIEPLDLASNGRTLLVLDRAGDVYGYDPESESWTLQRYDRPVGETSSHYHVALAADVGQTGQHYLLEGSYHFALRQQAERPDFIWPLPENHQIDLTVNQGSAYILSQSPISPTAGLIHYQDGARDDRFVPQLPLHRARQVQAVGSLVYILDNGGRRLTAVDAATGRLNALYKAAGGTPWSSFHVDAAAGQIILAAKDRLSFFGAPGEQVVISGNSSQPYPQIYDPALLQTLRGLLMPIGGSDITNRENQMPGAPRHYRLGVHEGADFYWHSGTPVRAVAAGTVIRAAVDYKIPSPEIFAAWSAAVYSLGYTSAEAHDFYRGMQVWIEHEGGLISRYVHLSAIDTMVQEGVSVEAGQIIGAVGNTGSPVSLEGPDADAHLHFELWLAGHYLGQYLRPIETNEWLAILLNEQ